MTVDWGYEKRWIRWFAIPNASIFIRYYHMQYTNFLSMSNKETVTVHTLRKKREIEIVSLCWYCWWWGLFSGFSWSWVHITLIRSHHVCNRHWSRITVLRTTTRLLRYYATFKVRKIESLFFKINAFLQQAITCNGLQAEQIFTVNI